MTRTNTNRGKLISIPILLTLPLLLTKPVNLYGEPSWNCAVAKAEFGARSCHQSIVFDDKMWILNGFMDSALSDVWYSTTGTEWRCATDDVPYPMRTYFAALVFKDHMWITGGYQAC